MAWEVQEDESEVRLSMQGQGASQGYRSFLGLYTYVHERVPAVIEVASEPRTSQLVKRDVSGSYRRLRCRGNAVFGCEKGVRRVRRRRGVPARKS